MGGAGRGTFCWLCADKCKEQGQRLILLPQVLGGLRRLLSEGSLRPEAGRPAGGTSRAWAGQGQPGGFVHPPPPQLLGLPHQPTSTLLNVSQVSSRCTAVPARGNKLSRGGICLTCFPTAASLPPHHTVGEHSQGKLRPAWLQPASAGPGHALGSPITGPAVSSCVLDTVWSREAPRRA